MNLIQGFLDGLRPEPILTVTEWADKYRKLPPTASAEPGQYRSSRTPYAIMPMDCLSSHSSYEKVVLMWGAQLGKTEIGNNWIGYVIDNSPAPTMMIQPTDAMVERNSKTRIDTMISSSETLSKKVAPKKSRSGDNTINQKSFNGGILILTSASSTAGLRSTPIKNLMLDEVDAYPYDLDGEGSPIDLAIARTRTFSKRKILITSTPTIDGHSAIQKEFLDTDQNYFHVPCPFCGEMQVLVFEQFKWKAGNPSTVKYECIGCKQLIEERFKTKMINEGKWLPSNKDKVSKKKIGFALSSLYSPAGWFGWADIIDSYEKALDEPAKMTTFVNTILGECVTVSGEAPRWENIYNRRETYAQNTLNKDICFITSGVDCQKDRLELEIVGWCADRSSYSIDYRVLWGNTTLPEVWQQLGEISKEKWLRPDGVYLGISRMAVDTGYNTSEVHAFCRKYISNVIPIKGVASLQLVITAPRQIDFTKDGKKIGKLKQWNVGVSMLKEEFYQWVTLEPNTDGTFPPNYCHFPQYESDYFEGITCEELIVATGKWVKRHKYNEPLDCRIYARAAASVVGLDRMNERQLKELGGFERKITEKKRKHSDYWD